MLTKKYVQLGVMAAALTALVAAPADASTAVNSRTVTFVGVSAEFNGELAVGLSDGQTYYAQPGNTDGCPSGYPVPSADTIKLWGSQAQAALLSGKTLSVGYNSCAGYRILAWMNLNP